MVSGPVLLIIKGNSRIVMNKWKTRPCFFTKSVKFRFGELSIGLSCSKSRDLQSEHGFRACSFKNKGEKLDFHTFGGQQSITKTEQLIDVISCFHFLFVFLPPKIWTSDLFLLFLKEQALKPCSDCRSRDSAQIRLIESSPNPNLTDLVKKQCSDFLWLLPCRR